MTRKAIRDNIKHLNNKRQRLIETKAPKNVITKVNQIVDLYENRQLSIFKTAERLINDMTTGTQKEKTRGIKKAEKAIEKFEAKAPLSERMNKTAEKAREGNTAHFRKTTFKKCCIQNKGTFQKSRNVFH